MLPTFLEKDKTLEHLISFPMANLKSFLMAFLCSNLEYKKGIKYMVGQSTLLINIWHTEAIVNSEDVRNGFIWEVGFKCDSKRELIFGLFFKKPVNIKK